MSVLLLPIQPEKVPQKPPTWNSQQAKIKALRKASMHGQRSEKRVVWQYSTLAKYQWEPFTPPCTTPKISMVREQGKLIFHPPSSGSRSCSSYSTRPMSCLIKVNLDPHLAAKTMTIPFEVGLVTIMLHCPTPTPSVSGAQGGVEPLPYPALMRLHEAL